MWIELTETHLKEALSGPEVEAFRTAALADGQSDPVPGLIEAVVRQIRSRVAACKSNTMGAGLTIPDETLNSAKAMLAWEMLTRLPGNDPSLYETREKRKNDALKYLDSIAKCDAVIEQPATPSEEVIATPRFEQVSGNPRQATRRKLSGL